MQALEKRVKKIVLLKEKLLKEESLTDKEKVKMEKKIKRMQKRFSHFHEDERLKMDIYFNAFGKHVVVDYDSRRIMVIKGEVPKSFRTQIFSFLLAYLILFLFFLTSVFLGAFGLIEERYVNATSFVMTLGSIVLNVWNLIDGYKWMKEGALRIFLILLPIIIIYNIINLIIDIMLFMD